MNPIALVGFICNRWLFPGRGHKTFCSTDCQQRLSLEAISCNLVLNQLAPGLQRCIELASCKSAPLIATQAIA